jgi:hypothetical protein
MAPMKPIPRFHDVIIFCSTAAWFEFNPSHRFPSPKTPRMILFSHEGIELILMFELKNRVFLSGAKTKKNNREW